MAIKSYEVPALARAFRILDILAAAKGGLNKMEIARDLRIPYSTAFNLLNTMVEYDYARKDEESGKYYLGFRPISLGNAQAEDLNVREVASETLQEVVEETGITAHLAILDRGEAVYIDKQQAESFFKLNTWVGKRNDVHASATGKALIADLSASELRALWNGPLTRRTPNTICSLRQLQAELAKIRQRGYAIDDQEHELGGRCVAAPIRDVSGKVIASVGLSGPVSQLPDNRIHKLGRTVQQAGRVISESMGYDGAE